MNYVIQEGIEDATSNASNNIRKKGTNPEILIIEPFYGGSHKELIDSLCNNLPSYTLIHLPAKKWHWRSRCGALNLWYIIPKVTTEKILFCSSVLNLAELIGIRQDLKGLKKIIYFHENQLLYPVQQIKERDVQYPYNQIISCLAADIILFNSNFNRESFLDNIKKIIKLIPDHRPKGIQEMLKEKSEVLYFPVQFPELVLSETQPENCDVLKIVWPHRWEFDKGPDDFFKILFQLKSEGYEFKLVILGECYNEVPAIIETAKVILEDNILHCGYVDSKLEYYKKLCDCNIAVSTSKHEFFGVAMLEAVFCGCLPLVPNNLVYPEIYPKNCLYSNLKDLYKQLKMYCQFPQKVIEVRKNLPLDLNRFSTKTLIPSYLSILTCD